MMQSTRDTLQVLLKSAKMCIENDITLCNAVTDLANIVKTQNQIIAKLEAKVELHDKEIGRLFSRVY